MSDQPHTPPSVTHENTDFETNSPPDSPSPDTTNETVATPGKY